MGSRCSEPSDAAAQISAGPPAPTYFSDRSEIHAEYGSPTPCVTRTSGVILCHTETFPTGLFHYALALVLSPVIQQVRWGPIAQIPKQTLVRGGVSGEIKAPVDTTQKMWFTHLSDPGFCRFFFTLTDKDKLGFTFSEVMFIWRKRIPPPLEWGNGT